MKTTLRILVGLVLLLVLGLIIAWVWIDSIAASAVERGGAYALGVPTDVDGVRVKLFRGNVGISELTVSNPEGYETPYLLSNQSLEVESDTGSLLSDTIEIPRIAIEGLDLYIEQKGGTNNIAVIMENLRRFETQRKPEAQQEAQKTVRVDQVIIRDITAHVQLLPIGGKASTVTVNVPLIELEDVSTDKPGGVMISELISRILPAVIAAVLESGEDILPADLAANIQGELAGVVDVLGGEAAKIIGQFEEGLGGILGGTGGQNGKLQEEAGRRIEDASRRVEEEVGGALEGLLGGRKKQDQQPQE